MSEEIYELRKTHARRTLQRLGVDPKTLEDMMQMWEQNYPVSIQDIMRRFNDVAKKLVDY